MLNKIREIVATKLAENFRGSIAQISVAAGVVILLALGAFGQMGWFPATDSKTGEQTGWFGKKVAKGSNIWNPLAETVQTGSLQLSKEYIYAGSRLLAIEEAGGGTTGTPTPTPPQGPAWTNVNPAFNVLSGEILEVGQTLSGATKATSTGALENVGDAFEFKVGSHASTWEMHLDKSTGGIFGKLLFRDSDFRIYYGVGLRNNVTYEICKPPQFTTILKYSFRFV